MRTSQIKVAAELITKVEKLTADIEFITKAYGEPTIKIFVELDKKDYCRSTSHLDANVREIDYITHQEVLGILGKRLADCRETLQILGVTL